jgi:hypothetical protein
MAFQEIDIFTDQSAAEALAEAFKKMGRVVKVESKSSLIVYDYRISPAKVLLDIEGSPLFTVVSEV